MVTLDVWETIRIRCVRDREPIKRVARELGVSKNTVRKYVQSQCVPQDNRHDRTSQVDAYRLQVDEWLRASPHITAKRIGTLLHERMGVDVRIGERALRRYIARRREVLVPKEGFVRAVYAPASQAQFDFTPVSAIIAGVLVTLQLFVMRLSYSGRIFARASWRCDQPALFAGILEALATFGGVPMEGVFDNPTTAVIRVLRGRARQENEAFRSFCGALAFPISFAAPAKGNEKGGVEGANHYVQDNFFTPVPEFGSVPDMNAALADFCERDQEREHSTHRETVAARFAREDPELRPMPEPWPRPCILRPVHINKFSEIELDTNRYTVPTSYAHRSALVEIYDGRLRILVDDKVVAEYPRSHLKHQMFLDPRHFLDLLAHKHRAAGTAAVFAEGRLPAGFLELRKRYVARDPQAGTKAWMSVVSLLHEHPAALVDTAIVHAMARGTDDPAAIALLVRQQTHPCPRTNVSLGGRAAVPQRSGAPVDLTAWAIAGLAESAP